MPLWQRPTNSNTVNINRAPLPAPLLPMDHPNSPYQSTALVPTRSSNTPADTSAFLPVHHDGRLTDPSPLPSDTPEIPVRPLRILVLDGGGFRGLGSLLVLQALMERVEVDAAEDTPIHLERHFDLVVGTSTGGLQALMLGRLGFSLEETETKYMEMGPKIFKDDNGALRWLTLGEGRFDVRGFEECLRMDLDGTAVLRSKEPHLKSAVLTTMADMPGRPIWLRSYPLPSAPQPPTGRHAWTIFEAARATSAAPVYFSPIEVYGSTFQDAGAAGFNNPTDIAIEEAQRIFPGREIGCIVSIGTGLGAIVMQHKGNKAAEVTHGAVESWKQRYKDIKGGSERVKTLAEHFISIATDTDRTHQRMLNRFRIEGIYHRFDIPGLGDMDLADLDHGLIRRYAAYYLNDEHTATLLERCASQIKTLPPVPRTTHIGPQPKAVPPPLPSRRRASIATTSTNASIPGKPPRIYFDFSRPRDIERTRELLRSTPRLVTSFSNGYMEITWIKTSDWIFDLDRTAGPRREYFATYFDETLRSYPNAHVTVVARYLTDKESTGIALITKSVDGVVQVAAGFVLALLQDRFHFQVFGPRRQKDGQILLEPDVQSLWSTESHGNKDARLELSLRNHQIQLSCNGRPIEYHLTIPSRVNTHFGLFGYCEEGGRARFKSFEMYEHEDGHSGGGFGEIAVTHTPKDPMGAFEATDTKESEPTASASKACAHRCGPACPSLSLDFGTEASIRYVYDKIRHEKRFTYDFRSEYLQVTPRPDPSSSRESQSMYGKPWSMYFDFPEPLYPTARISTTVVLQTDNEHTGISLYCSSGNSMNFRVGFALSSIRGRLWLSRFALSNGNQVHTVGEHDLGPIAMEAVLELLLEPDGRPGRGSISFIVNGRSIDVPSYTIFRGEDIHFGLFCLCDRGGLGRFKRFEISVPEGDEPCTKSSSAVSDDTLSRPDPPSRKTIQPEVIGSDLSAPITPSADDPSRIEASDRDSTWYRREPRVKVNFATCYPGKDTSMTRGLVHDANRNYEFEFLDGSLCVRSWGDGSSLTQSSTVRDDYWATHPVKNAPHDAWTCTMGKATLTGLEIRDNTSHGGVAVFEVPKQGLGQVGIPTFLVAFSLSREAYKWDQSGFLLSVHRPTTANTVSVDRTIEVDTTPRDASMLLPWEPSPVTFALMLRNRFLVGLYLDDRNIGQQPLEPVHPHSTFVFGLFVLGWGEVRFKSFEMVVWEK